jgi:hypothetical protein
MIMEDITTFGKSEMTASGNTKLGDKLGNPKQSGILEVGNIDFEENLAASGSYEGCNCISKENCCGCYSM